jgi:predicted RNA methylase
MQILDALGYSESKRFYRRQQVDDLPANELAFAVRSAVRECVRLGKSSGGARFEGTYVLQRDPKEPAIPVVYVVRVETEALARAIHQFVWNQNQTPFLIVESPSWVRVYPGFSFETTTDRPIVEVAQEAADALGQLSALRARSIDDGVLWQTWGRYVDPKQRVDESLLRDLDALDRRLQKQGATRRTSHGLIGKFVYLRYLHDRGILSAKKLAKWGIDPDHVFSRHATLKAFREVNRRLQEWLNGAVFSLGEEELSGISAAQLRLVADVFRGASPVGEHEVQQSLLDRYDFSQIPIETLSCVYEQFLHDSAMDGATSRGKELGAYYTPVPLTDYVLSELEQRRPLTVGMKVLDPSCGSGAFLVQCYRRLIERRRREIGRELRATEVRSLLTEHLFGIDRDHDACRVTELSLIMTLLDYVEPPDLEGTSFKLPSLRKQNIFEGDFFETQGAANELLSENQFDWIVGNPPWSEVKKVADAQHDHFPAHCWMQQNKKTHPTSGKQIAEAFLWKAGEHLTPRGVCGLVVQAMTWFKKEATPFRKQFFSRRRVWCLANFANLAYVLFAGRSRRPASVVFFENGTPHDDDVIVSFAPFVAEQIANRPDQPNRQQKTWNIIVGSNDVREIEIRDAQQGGSLIWKLAMWGTSRDRRLLERLDARFRDQTFESLKSLGIVPPRQGLELRKSEGATSEPLEHHPELAGKWLLEMNSMREIGPIFAFPPESLVQIDHDRCYVREGRFALPMAVSTPPHVIVDASRRFAVFSDQFLVVPPRQIGIAGDPASAPWLRALSLFLSSDFTLYHQFFNSPQWGVDANRADLSALLAIPLPITTLSDDAIQEWVELQQRLAAASVRQFNSQSPISRPSQGFIALQQELNNRVFDLLRLKPYERWLIEDFVQLHLERNMGKVTPEVLRIPTPEERQSYLHALRNCLDAFLSAQRGFRHKIEMLADGDSALLAVSLMTSPTAIEPLTLAADQPTSQNLRKMRDDLRSRHSQWVYFDRGLKVYSRGVLYQFKPLQRLHWTRRQAVLDADDIIAESLGAKSQE